MKWSRVASLTVAIIGIIILAWLPTDALRAESTVNDVKSIPFISFELLLFIILKDVNSIAVLVGMMKGGYLGLNRLIILSCEGWSEETFNTVRKYTHGDSRLQSYLLSPACIALLPISLPSDFTIENDGYSALPLRKLDNAYTFVKALQALSWADPYCWYRFYLSQYFSKFLKEACEEFGQEMMKTDLDDYIVLVPDLGGMSEQTMDAWLNHLINVAQNGNEAQFPLLYFYLFQQLLKWKENTGNTIVRNTMLKVLNYWERRARNASIARFTEYLLFAEEKEPEITSAIGIDEKSSTSLLHLAIIMAVGKGYYGPLWKDLCRLFRGRLEQEKSYGIIDLINLLTYLQYAFQRPPLEERPMVRELLGSKGLTMMMEYLNCPTEWSFLYFAFTPSERILHYRRWFHELPIVEYDQIKGFGYETEQIRKESLALVCDIWRFKPINKPGADFKRDLQKRIDFLKENILATIIKESEQKDEFNINLEWITKIQFEALESFLLYTSFLRLHYDDCKDGSSVNNKCRTPIIDREWSKEFIITPTPILISDGKVITLSSSKLASLLEIVHNFSLYIDIIDLDD